MDFKDPENKNELKNKIHSLINEYNDLLIDLVDNPITYKKSALLYYWLRDYKNYIKNENTFNPKYYPEFYRGSIVNINFGFNLGSELGGLHYAIVLQNSNRKNPNITVIPLTSLKPDKDIKQLRPTELYLGQELYFKIQGKYEALKISIPTELRYLRNIIVHSAQTDSKDVQQKIEELSKQSELMVKTMNKLKTLKYGSIAVMNQIRTVSKMRIIDPTNEYDILYNLRLSTNNLNLIDKKIVELFTKQA